MTQLASIYIPGKGNIKVCHDEKERINPYKVYHEFTEPGTYTENGEWIPARKCKHLKAKYADYLSCFYLIYQYIAKGEIK